jgi:PIN domain nuclease of toxin-antitoxin system
VRFLLDTHIVLSILRGQLRQEFPALERMLANEGTQTFVSVASLWEIAIKTRLGKLDPGLPLDGIARNLEAGRIEVLPVTAAHATAALSQEPITRDPFDRMLLSVCAIETLKLLTIDRALVAHPLAARAHQ